MTTKAGRKTMRFEGDYGVTVGEIVHIWERYRSDGKGERGYYINRRIDGLDPATQRITGYGIRGHGQGEDGIYHLYIGPASVIDVTEVPYWCDEPADVQDIECAGMPRPHRHTMRTGVVVEMVE